MNEDRLIRIDEVLRKIPVSKSRWWAGVASGIYPRPTKLGARITCWRLSEIEKLIRDGLSENKE